MLASRPYRGSRHHSDALAAPVLSLESVFEVPPYVRWSLSALAVMARIEAAFQVDYKRRCDGNKSDPVSVAFRRISRSRGRKARLDEDIWETWRSCHLTTSPIISQLRSVFKFRHWLAHGRYWQHGNKYDFQTLYGLAVVVFNSFPFAP
jgi:hypothetical protein